jgi:hypothetical protein
MLQSLINTLYAKWREDRVRKGSYEYTVVDQDKWRLGLVKGDQEDYYYFFVFILHPAEPVSIEGDLTEEEQIMKDIMDDMTQSDWTLIGMETIDYFEDADPTAIILSRLNMSPQ